MKWPRSWMLSAGLQLVGCNQSLGNYGLVEDLRILGMRADPPEILLDGPASLDTTFEALVVSPTPKQLRYTWSLCPIDSATACHDFDLQAQLASPADAAMLRRLRVISQSGVVAPGDTDASTAYAIPPFNPRAASLATHGEDLTPWLYDFFRRQNLLNAGLGVWPSAILVLEDDAGERLEAQKRVVLGVQDWTTLADALGVRFGFSVCPTSTKADAAAPPSGCVNLPPHSANTNPTLAGLDIAIGQTSEAFTTIVDPQPVPLNTEVRLRPRFTEASFEEYVTLRADLQTQAVEIQPRTEQLSVSWFHDAGTVPNNLTWPLFTKTLTNAFSTPRELPNRKSAIVTLWVVARDQRGGESWTTLRILSRP